MIVILECWLRREKVDVGRVWVMMMSDEDDDDVLLLMLVDILEDTTFRYL